MLTEWQSPPCQLLASPGWSLYLHSSLQGAPFSRACVALPQRRGVRRRCGRAAASSWTFPESRKEQRRAWSLGNQNPPSVVVSLVSPSTDLPQSPPRRWRVWYLCGQTEFTKEKEKWRGMKERESTEGNKKEKMGTGETLRSEFK